MSNKQPEALRLADAMDAVNANNADSLLVQMSARCAAIELRRQHALIEELTEAVQAFIAYDDRASQDGFEFMALYAKAVDASRAAIAKAEVRQ